MAANFSLATSCRIGLTWLALFSTAAAQVDPQLRQEIVSTLNHATKYFRDTHAVHGGYVYHYSLDHGTRWGEGKASAKQIWVQPPGTPTVGLAYLKAYEATGQPIFLSAARDAARSLAFGQLRSGGWQNQIDLQGLDRGDPYSGGQRRKEGFSSLDDGQSQSAIQLMVRVDQALKFKDQSIHASALLSLESLLAAQFPNGAFPQGWRGPAKKIPIVAASYPKYDWRTENRIKNYWDMYTLNDNVCGFVLETLSSAYEVYRDPKYLTAIRKLGDFLVLAQMPEPQPAWAQQYDYQMRPIWARKFEPAAIAGDESQEVIETLMKIYQLTGDKKYLQPIPAALEYLKRSLLKDGRLARYYELKTNRPLYMVRQGQQYSLTYDDRKLPKHYGWKWTSRIPQLEAQFKQLSAGQPLKPRRISTKEVQSIIADLDSQGRWVSTYDGAKLVGQAKMKAGEKYLSSEIFSRNLNKLAQFLIERDSK